MMVWKMIFPFQGAVFSGSMLIFRGVSPEYWWLEALKFPFKMLPNFRQTWHVVFFEGVHLLVGGFSPTHLKSMLVKMDHSPIFWVKIKILWHHHLAMYTTPLIQCFFVLCNMMLHWFISLFEKSWSMLSTSKVVTLLKGIAHVVWLTRGRFFCWLALCRITIHHSRSLWQDSDYLDETYWHSFIFLQA